VRAATPLPFVSIIEETCKVALDRRPGLRTAGVLAAAGALDARLYETAFARFGVEAITPQGESRRRFMDMLYRIKAGDLGPTVRAGVRLCAEELIGRGSDVIVAGCTEVPLVLAPEDLDRPFIDSTESLAARVVAYARGEPLPR
jgi:aspartate racemase